MNLDSGTLTVCTLQNRAEAGRMPVMALAQRSRHWYGERTVGYGRYYAAMGANQRIDLLVRLHQDRGIQSGMYAVLGNGEQYRIESVAQGGEDTELKWTDLTLVRLEDRYDVVTE